eukprot:scaffold2621_cov64-Phaeocystis_antarctica.AAC.8
MRAAEDTQRSMVKRAIVTAAVLATYGRGTTMRAHVGLYGPIAEPGPPLEGASHNAGSAAFDHAGSAWRSALARPGLACQGRTQASPGRSRRAQAWWRA